MAGLARDVTEFLDSHGLPPVTRPQGLRVAYHAACSLQHGQRIVAAPKELLAEAGFAVVVVGEPGGPDRGVSVADFDVHVGDVVGHGGGLLE